MKKRIGLFLGLLLGFCTIGGTAIGINHAYNTRDVLVARAEGEEAEPTPTPEITPTPTAEEIFECKVTIAEAAHGKISVDKEKGHVGDIVTITAKPEMFYLVKGITVNGTSLIESEETRDEFSFILVEGENTIAATFEVNKELLGELSIIYEQAMNKDWTNLFSVENVIRVVTFLLNGGILFAIIRYYIKDKKLADRLEKATKQTLAELVPDTTKKAVIANIREVIAPLFAEIVAKEEENTNTTAVLVKCIALQQEGTPEARRAILDELSNLKVGDDKTIEEAKATITKYVEDKIHDLDEVMTQLNSVIDKNKEVANKVANKQKVVVIKKED